jgi:DNA-binding response OmpR family regulator
MSMEPTAPLPRKPLAVVAGQHAWLVRSIESILSSNGFTAVSLSEEVLFGEESADLRPDLLVLEADPPELAWAEQFQRLRAQRVITPTVPVIATTAEPLTREKRLEAMRAGAWDVFGHPLDAEMLMLKATAYVKAKFEVDAARDRGLIDPETDFYNVRGVLRRI